MIKTIGAAALIASLLASTAMADSAGAPSEGKMNLKARLGYMHISGGSNFSGADEDGDTGTITNSLKNGPAAEIAMNYFVSNNIAIEGSLGFGRSKDQLAVSINGEVGEGTGKKKVNIIPLAAIVQYHFMPEASVSPYIGVGYSYQFITGGYKTLEHKNGGNAVGQVGVDFAFNDTMGFNIDVKHILKTKHDSTFKDGEDSFTLKHKFSTTTVMAGVTFPF